MSVNPEQLHALTQDIKRAFQQLDYKHTAAQTNLRQRLLGLRRRTYELEAINQLRIDGKSPRYPVEFRAQFNEDCLAYDLFARQQTGYFIEVGAFDGYEFSVTYALECLGWTGLLVEGIPQRAQACAARRHHAKVVHSALGRRGCAATTEFTVVADQYGGMLSFNTTSDESRQRFTASGTPAHIVKVPQAPLDTILENDPAIQQYGNEIDLASIDVEGGELDVLHGFDLNHWKPKVILIEDNHDHTGSSDVARYMQGQPYHQAGWLEVNRIYLRNDLKHWGTRLSQWW